MLESLNDGNFSTCHRFGQSGSSVLFKGVLEEARDPLYNRVPLKDDVVISMQIRGNASGMFRNKHCSGPRNDPTVVLYGYFDIAVIEAE